MKSTIEPVEGNKIKLSVTVEESELGPAIDNAWRQIGKEVRIPGFRAGKVPRKVLEQRFPPGYARSEALNEAVPSFYVDALREHEIDVIAQPEVEITSGEEEGDVAFDAVVEVRPAIIVVGYQNLTIEIPNPHPSDDDIADQIDRLRGNYGEMVAVERPAATGDYVTMDIAGTRDGEELEGLVAEDYSYEVGSGAIVADLDDQLRGLKSGDAAEFEAPHPDPDETEPVHFAIAVKEIKERVLPDLTDEWVAEATEFTTVDELRDNTIERLSTVRRSQASMAVQAKIGDALAGLVTDEVPEALASVEMRARLEDLVRRLSSQGIGLDQYLQVTGTDPQVFTDDLRETALQSCKVDLALRAIAVAEGLAPTDDDLEEEFAKIGAQVDLDPEIVRERIVQNDQMLAVKSDIGNRAALAWLTEHVDIVDEAGTPVNREDLDLEPEDDLEPDHDHDHDHDHAGHDHD